MKRLNEAQKRGIGAGMGLGTVVGLATGIAFGNVVLGLAGAAVFGLPMGWILSKR